jgi:NurA-like 5'-3' nuclease
MIASAAEFHRLRTSNQPEGYRRAAIEAADEAVWLDVIASYPDMRFWVAQNKTVPLSILRLLARDKDSEVRIMMAMKRKLDLELFDLLSRDQDPAVRHSIALNLNVPLKVLNRLAGDEETFVANAAIERLA